MKLSYGTKIKAPKGQLWVLRCINSLLAGLSDLLESGQAAEALNDLLSVSFPGGSFIFTSSVSPLINSWQTGEWKAVPSVPSEDRPFTTPSTRAALAPVWLLEWPLKCFIAVCFSGGFAVDSGRHRLHRVRGDLVCVGAAPNFPGSFLLQSAAAEPRQGESAALKRWTALLFLAS